MLLFYKSLESFNPAFLIAANKSLDPSFYNKKVVCDKSGCGEIPEAPPVAEKARESSEKTGSNGAAPRRQCDHVFEGSSALRDGRLPAPRNASTNPDLSRQRNRFRRGAEAAFIGSAAALSRPRRKPGPAFCYIRKRSVRICCFPL